MGSKELIIVHSVGPAAVSKFTYAAPTELVAFKGTDFYKDWAPTDWVATHSSQRANLARAFD
jgi:hypothetical protein